MTNLLVLTALVAGFQEYGVKDIVQVGFRDAKFVAVGTKGVQKELKKINDDFAQSYRFSQGTAFVKEPFMIRLESQVDDTKLIYIMNGTRKYYKVGRAPGIPVDVANAPGKRQTCLDFGLLTPSLFTDLMEADFQRVDRETGDLVFDINYKKKCDDTSKHRIWVDKAKRYVKKRVWFNQEGRQLATFLYENPQNGDGVWLPTKCTVRNNENNIAGITEYRQMTINSGVDASLFKF